MTNPKGTQLETAARNWLREHGWPFARRVVKEGAADKGDLTLGDGIPVTIEAKNTKKIDLAAGARELADEMANNEHPWGFTIHKKRGTTDVGKYYAVLPVEVLMDILANAVEHRRLLRGDEGMPPPSHPDRQLLDARGDKDHDRDPPQRKRVIPRISSS